jgi:tetratricopeptide (TPR) repeat protein
MRWTIAAIFLLTLLLSGCAAGPVPVASSTGASAAATTGIHAERSPVNPYLQGRPAVPAEAQRRFEQVQLLIAMQEWQGALLELQALADAYPQLSGISLEIALLHRQLGDTEQAQLWFQRSIASNASNIGAYNEYGIFLREQGQFGEAESIYLLALEQWEASADTHRNIGILYDLYLAEPQKALQHYQRCQDLTDGTDPEVTAWIADLERRQDAGRGMASS